MHGMILSQFKVFLKRTFRAHLWLEITSQMNLERPLRISPLRTYDDPLFSGLVDTTAELLGIDRPSILEAFGRHLAEFFYTSYKHMMDSSWTFEQMLMRTEHIMHRQVRFSNVGAAPPELQVAVVSDTTIEVLYQGERRLCALAKGLIQGFGHIFGKTIQLEEHQCLLRGDDVCRIRVIHRERLG